MLPELSKTREEPFVFELGVELFKLPDPLGQVLNDRYPLLDQRRLLGFRDLRQELCERHGSSSIPHQRAVRTGVIENLRFSNLTIGSEMEVGFEFRSGVWMYQAYQAVTPKTDANMHCFQEPQRPIDDLPGQWHQNRMALSTSSTAC